MAIIVIPRSETISPKIVASSDFEKYFGFISDYVITGLAVTDGGGLNASVATGEARIKGIHFKNDASATVVMTASSTNKLYARVLRDGSSEVQSGELNTTTGALPADSLLLATVVTGVSTITSIATNPTNSGSQVKGLQDLSLPAQGWTPRTTNGSSVLTATQTTTNLIMRNTLDFDQTTQEFAQIAFPFPRNFDNGTIKVTVYWTFLASSGGVVWGLKSGAYSDDDALDVALGTEVTITDTALTIGDIHVSPQSAAITIAGTPVDKDWVVLQISRNPADASDTLAADAMFLGVSIEFTIDSAVAA